MLEGLFDCNHNHRRGLLDLLGGTALRALTGRNGQRRTGKQRRNPKGETDVL